PGETQAGGPRYWFGLCRPGGLHPSAGQEACGSMTFSPQLEARFDKLLKSYPPGRQRSAMIPMLLYGQYEVGSVTDELIDEVARRIGVTPLQVNEVLSYY